MPVENSLAQAEKPYQFGAVHCSIFWFINNWALLMPLLPSIQRLQFNLARLREKLWVRPLFFCLLSVAAVFAAALADDTRLGEIVPQISADSLESLLSVMASSMLVIATFAVGSMVSAYASASSTATPRSFKLVVSDDSSQNALSAFIGAFIFSIVALIAVKNGYFGKAGLFILFVIQIAVFAIVILTFVRWVDRIARLGRVGTTVVTTEQAATKALDVWRQEPSYCALPLAVDAPSGQSLSATEIGYIQHINVAELQACATRAGGMIVVSALPGSFASPGRPLAYLVRDPGKDAEFDHNQVIDCFVIGKSRTFYGDPRFGFVVLSEIADRALSPGVNDPGTAIEVIGVMERLFVLWDSPAPEQRESQVKFDRVQIPPLTVDGAFDDAFTAIARDGAAILEVSIRLQETLHALARTGSGSMRKAAVRHSRLALARAELAMSLPEDIDKVREAAAKCAAYA